MSIYLKNTLILILLFLMITGFGVYRVHIYTGKKLKKVERTNEQKREKIKEIYDKVKDFDQAEIVLNEIKEKWNKREKILKKSEKSGPTLAFLNKIAFQKDSKVKFNFKFVEKRMENGYGLGKYKIEGEGFYNNVYSFISKIEKDRNLYKVESLNVRAVERLTGKSKKPITPVSFSFNLNVYFNPDEEVSKPDIKRKPKIEMPVINPFNPIVKKKLPPNTRGLIEVEDAKLEAVSVNMVLVRDKKGRFKSLKVGDEVYLGYLTDVYPQRGEARFTLNKGGFIQRVTLKIFFED